MAKTVSQKKSKKETSKTGKSLIILGTIAVIIAAAVICYNRFFEFPGVPKELTATPIPLFVVDHYVSGEIVGLINKRSFPKDATMEITPFLESGTKHLYGDTFVLCGENVHNENATTIVYSENERLTQKFNILCQSYEDELVLKVRIDLISGARKTKTVIKSIGEVFTYDSIVDTYAKKLVPWKKTRNILIILSIIALLLAFAGIAKLGIFSEWAVNLGFTTFVICLLVLILPISRISHVKKEKDILLHTLENTKQIIEIRNSIPASNDQEEIPTIINNATDTLVITSQDECCDTVNQEQSSKIKGFFKKIFSSSKKSNSSNP